MLAAGAFWFGTVIGFVTYRTLHHREKTAIGDLSAVIAAIGGAAIVKLFPAGGASFDHYAFGLAAGFFGYLAISLALGLNFGPKQAKAFLDRNETTGDRPRGRAV